MEKPTEESSASLSTVGKALRSLKVKSLSEIQVILFGLSAILGNRSTGWNSGLSSGYEALVINFFVTFSGFLCLALCMGEMSSALPFSGGIFGFVRAALGPHWGFLVACCEFTYNTTMTANKVQRITNGSSAGNVDEAGIVAIFAVCLLFNLIGGKPIFVLTSLLGLFLTALFTIYLLGTLSSVNTDQVSFSTYAGPFQDMTWESFMAVRITIGSHFNGIQYFPLLSEYMKDPRDQVPRVMIICTCIFLVYSLLISLAAISQVPGGAKLAKAPLPLQYGFARMFSVDMVNANWLDFPCQFGAVFGLFYFSGKQLAALAKSGLLPAIFEKTIPGADTPYVAYTFVACAGVALNIFALNNPAYVPAIKGTFLMAAYYIFVNCFIAFLVFRRKFSSMSRTFVNPLGDASAIYGIVNFLFAAVGVCRYSNIDPQFLIGLVCLLVVASIFFWTYLVKHQKFSEEEKKVLFKAYLINANRQSRLKRLKNNKVGPSATSAPSRGKYSYWMEGILLSFMKYIIGSQSKVSHASKQFQSTAHVESAASPRSDQIDEAPKQKDEEIRLPETNHCTSLKQTSTYLSPLTTTVDSDGPSTKLSAKLSTKIITYLSGKLSGVAPSMNEVDEGEVREYEQLAALAAGGIMSEVEEEALKERLGLDVESSELMGEICGMGGMGDDEVKNEREGDGMNESMREEEIKNQLEDMIPLEVQLSVIELPAESHLVVCSR